MIIILYILSYDLYNKAYIPWEWHGKLKEEANKLGMELFSSPFDISAVDYLENLDMPAYKIASFEITDHILIKKVAQTGKSIIISSGMASVSDLNDAVSVLRENGLLKCKICEILWNRDENNSNNIYKISKCAINGNIRSPYLSRTKLKF